MLRLQDYVPTAEASMVSGTASSGTKGGQFKDATTFTDYDANGNKVLVVEGNEANGSELSIRQMLYAADGSLLRMQQSALEKGDGDALTQVKTRLAQIRAGQSTALHQSRESRHISSNGDYLGEIAVLRGDVNNARDNWYFSSTIKEQHFSSELAAGNASERHTVRAGDTLP